jgi:ribosomal protein L4
MAKSKTDAQMIARLKREAPEVLEREVDFDALVVRVITAAQRRKAVQPHRSKIRGRRRASERPA